MLSKLPPFTKNFFFISSIIFLIWMIFFDSNDFINQFRASRKIKDLESQKTFYEEKIEEVKKEREAFLNNPKELERFARENYLMKKKNEDVFIIVDEE
ncbi:MAG: septum formation initiator family protein [Sporocytophaga sp.]|nr:MULTISPECIES: septum formation initiator family protein [Sporocytophaga]MBO9699612.1 septum formation initiator family protein [Sporocytophaga sp.]